MSTALFCPILVPGREASGRALILEKPISFWGGVDPKTGTISDPRHPQHGASVAGRVVFLAGTIGSSSASAVLLELVRAGNAPAALVMHEADAILLLGLIVAREVGWDAPIAVRLEAGGHTAFAGTVVRVGEGGCVTAL